MSDIKPKKVKSQNIQKSINNFSSEMSITADECNFKINDVATYIKTSSDESFQIFNENINEYYKDKSKIANEHVEFKQVYIITIGRQLKPKVKLHYSIDFGEFSTTPKIIIHPDSQIPYKACQPKELYTLLLNELNKIKTLNSILINIFDELMIKNLKNFIKYIYAGKFVKKIQIPLFQGLEPEITRESKLIMWFEQKESNHQIIEVEEHELLVEYRKPKYGKNGLNAFGKQIDSNVKNNKEGFQGSVDSSTIEILENEDKILYKSKVKGFVQFEKNHLYVDNKVKMSKLSRVQDSLAKDEDNNVEVIVSQNDTTEDSIGEGVKLTSETIHVTGFIGSKSVLEAVNLKVDGATHQDSLQFAKFASINRHKGTLKCHNAKIDLLEGGEIHGTKVEVHTAIGGIIYAQDVIINNVKNNLKVYASNSITINLVSGEDNLFKISYKDIPILQNRINFINRDIEDLQYTLEEAQRHNKDQVSSIKDEISELKNAQKSIQDSALKAKIFIEKPLHGLNVINFTLKSGDELIYKTDAKSYDTFYLEEKDDSIILHPVNKTISLNS